MKSFLIAILLGSATLAADGAPAVASAEAACGPDNAKFDIKAVYRQQVQPEPGKALVFVAEEYDRSANGMLTPTVRVGLDGAWVGADRGKSHLFFSVEPGEHHLCADWKGILWIDRKVALNGFTAEPGQTYYFRARIGVQGRSSSWTLDLDAVGVDEGRLLVEQSSLIASRQKK